MERDTAEPVLTLEQSFLNPTNGSTGLAGIVEGLDTARRRIGVLLAALSNGDPGHPVMAEDRIRETVISELMEFESILDLVAAEAGQLRQQTRPAQA